ncbi:MAG: HAD family hydrolase [Firmicutes bacterium]|nr:HAD family hydrolase [Bacillota bacterium]
MPIDLDRVNYLLFDLDGTLLPMNMDVFVEAYIKRLTVRAAAYLPPESFPKYLWAATGAMIESGDPEAQNHEVFWAHFSRFARHPREVLEPVFEEFYLNEFTALIDVTQPSPVAREIVNLAVGRGKQVVLATNPIFPGIAVRERMRWADIHDLPWLHVTTYENSRYCKPNPAYYRDLLQQLAIPPGECLMIGNDVQEDLVASELGIATCLITDCLLDRGAPAYEPDWRGGLAELRDWLRG